MSAINTMTEVTDLNQPEIRAIAKRVINEMRLAIEKVASHHAEPARFPLPSDSTSVERILHGRFRQLKPAQQQLAVAKLLPNVNAAPQKRAVAYADLAQVDLQSAAPIAQQVQALPFPKALMLPANTAQNLLNEQIMAPTQGVTEAAAAPALKKLELRIHKVTCRDETGKDFNPFGDEPGSDEIFLGGTAVDETGDSHKVTSFKVGDFDDGDVKTYAPPKPFTSFDLREGNLFPKSYFVTLVLVEKDQGGMSDFINGLLNKIKERVTAALAAAFGSAVGLSGGPAGAVIGAAVGFVVGKVFDLLKSAWNDDIFPPKTVSVKIAALTSRFADNKADSPEDIVKFVGHDGHYEVRYDWRMFN